MLPAFRYRGDSLTTSASGVLEASFTPVVEGSLSMHAVAAGGQSWLSGASPSELTELAFRVQRGGTGVNGMARGAVYAHTGTFGNNGVPTGSPLVVSRFYELDEASASGTWYVFSISGWTPDPSTHYVSVLEFPDCDHGDGSHHVDVIRDNTTGADGNHSTLPLDLTTWSSVGSDLGFRVYSVSGGGVGVGIPIAAYHHYHHNTA